MEKIEIITFSNLQPFFYDQLSVINAEYGSLLPDEMIYYSSDILARYAQSDLFFDRNDSGISERTLGWNLMESKFKSHEEQRRLVQQVGDLSLIKCGFFKESLRDSILNRDYYIDLGKMAYRRLNVFQPECFDMKEFFSILSDSFEKVMIVISRLADETKTDPEKHYLFNFVKTTSTN